MKKITTIFAVGAIILIASTGCTKHPKPDIVKYTVNGKSYEVTGAYSDLDFKGIGKSIKTSKITYKAVNDYWFYMSTGENFSSNTNTFFNKQDVSNINPNMSIKKYMTSSSERKLFQSIDNKKSYFIITKNESRFIEGNFSGWLYHMGMFGDEPISDSLEITNGYFYLNK